jgi:N-acetylglutamate synthase-like GNAT family acetyltransferase
MKTPVKFKIVKASERHRADINRLCLETRISDGVEGSIKNSWVAKVGDRVVGFAAMEFINKRAAVLTNLAVEKKMRHFGIGAALIEKRFENARKHNVEVLLLITMYYHFNFYKRRGFCTIPRKELADDLRAYSQFTAKRYMKCAVMINENLDAPAYVSKRSSSGTEHQ